MRAAECLCAERLDAYGGTLDRSAAAAEDALEDAWAAYCEEARALERAEWLAGYEPQAPSGGEPGK